MVKSASSASGKVFPSCKQCFANKKRKCPTCKIGLEKPEEQNLKFDDKNDSDPYKAIKVTGLPNNIIVTPGEPDMLNPAGYESISTILRKAGKRASIASYSDDELEILREWLIFENDWTIYRIIANLIQNVLKCNNCKKSYYGKENFEEHLCFLTQGASFEREFDWIVQQVGLLHLEMNAGRSFVNLNWDVFMKEVMKALNFTSEHALLFMKKGTDHHKLWSILETIYIAIADELLIPYMRQSLNVSKSISISGFWDLRAMLVTLTIPICWT